MEKKSLPEKAIIVFKIWTTIIMSVLSFISGIVAAFNFYTAVIFMMLSAIWYYYVMFFYCRKKYENEYYSISSEKIYREKGVFFKRETEIFTDQIQCIKIITEPIPKLFDLYTVIFYTSGYNEKIALIDFQEAKNIKESLQVKIKDEI